MSGLKLLAAFPLLITLQGPAYAGSFEYLLELPGDEKSIFEFCFDPRGRVYKNEMPGRKPVCVVDPINAQKSKIESLQSQLAAISKRPKESKKIRTTIEHLKKTPALTCIQSYASERLSSAFLNPMGLPSYSYAVLAWADAIVFSPKATSAKIVMNTFPVMRGSDNSNGMTLKNSGTVLILPYRNPCLDQEAIEKDLAEADRLYQQENIDQKLMLENQKSVFEKYLGTKQDVQCTGEVSVTYLPHGDPNGTTPHPAPAPTSNSQDYRVWENKLKSQMLDRLRKAGVKINGDTLQYNGVTIRPESVLRACSNGSDTEKSVQLANEHLERRSRLLVQIGRGDGNIYLLDDFQFYFSQRVREEIRAKVRLPYQPGMVGTQMPVVRPDGTLTSEPLPSGIYFKNNGGTLLICNTKGECGPDSPAAEVIRNYQEKRRPEGYEFPLLSSDCINEKRLYEKRFQ